MSKSIMGEEKKQVIGRIETWGTENEIVDVQIDLWEPLDFHTMGNRSARGACESR